LFVGYQYFNLFHSAFSFFVKV